MPPVTKSHANRYTATAIAIAGTIGRLSNRLLTLSSVVAKPMIDGVTVELRLRKLPWDANSCPQS